VFGQAKHLASRLSSIGVEHSLAIAPTSTMVDVTLMVGAKPLHAEFAHVNSAPASSDMPPPLNVDMHNFGQAPHLFVVTHSKDIGVPNCIWSAG